MSKGNYYLQDEKPLVRKKPPPRCSKLVWLNGKPNDHQCQWPATKNGLCSRHQPEAMALVKAKREVRLKAKGEVQMPIFKYSVSVYTAQGKVAVWRVSIENNSDRVKICELGVHEAAEALIEMFKKRIKP